MSASTLDSHEKMRGRDVSKVARGEQAPRPPQQSPQVSRAPPPSSTSAATERAAETAKPDKSDGDRMMRRRCYESYFEYYKCVQENGAEALQCKKVGEFYKAFCPQWTGTWSIN